MNSPTAPTPRALVLGAGAGGGSPQWNCNCSICQRVRSGEAPRRTQTSLAVSADGDRWVLINASPDLREQIAENPPLHPDGPGRDSPIDAVVLTGGEIDQITGLLSMREGEPFALYASDSVHETLGNSAMFEALDREVVDRRPMPLDEPIAVSDADGKALDVTVQPFAAPGKIPLYEETPGQTPEIGETTEDNVALRIEVGSATLFFIPCCARVPDWLKRRVTGSQLMLFDGTLWRDDELIEAGLADKTGRRMGHVSIDGPDGALQALSDVAIDRKVFIHLNNSNPVLLADSDERRRVEQAGWEVAADGMELLDKPDDG